MCIIFEEISLSECFIDTHLIELRVLKIHLGEIILGKLEFWSGPSFGGKNRTGSEKKLRVMKRQEIHRFKRRGLGNDARWSGADESDVWVDKRGFWVSWISCVLAGTSNYVCLKCFLEKWALNSGEKDILGTKQQLRSGKKLRHSRNSWGINMSNSSTYQVSNGSGVRHKAFPRHEDNQNLQF